MKRYQVYLTEVQHRRLAQMAKDAGLRLSELLRRIIDDFLRHEERRP